MMNQHDRFEHDDAAYVLGALDPGERTAYELHLRTCPECTDRVAEARATVGLLDGLRAEDLAPADADVPETLLPGLLRRVHAERRRRHWLVGTLAGVAAACAIALAAVVVWPSGSGTSAGRPMTAVAAAVPVSATAQLDRVTWGTHIELHCHYVPGSDESAQRYRLVVYPRHGQEQRLGSWTLPPYQDMTYESGTSLRPDQIAAVAITLPDGTPVLKLAT